VWLQFGPTTPIKVRSSMQDRADGKREGGNKGVYEPIESAGLARARAIARDFAAAFARALGYFPTIAMIFFVSGSTIST
jgi:hypothetical protein